MRCTWLSRSTLTIDVGVKDNDNMLRDQGFQLYDHSTNISLALTLQGKIKYVP